MGKSVPFPLQFRIFGAHIIFDSGENGTQDFTFDYPKADPTWQQMWSLWEQVLLRRPIGHSSQNKNL